MDVENLAKELILKNMTPEQQMAVLEGIKSTVAEAKEVQKRKIGENVDIVVQALKKIEADIRSRYDDVGNAIEKRVASIKDGRDGIDGKDGRDGKDGKSGRDGAKGDKGDAGRDGRDGVDGADGVSVTSAHIDFDGSLIITLSTGVELNVGEVVAPDLAERIKVITNGGGTSQSVLDTLASLQTQINNLIPSQTGNSGKFLTTNGSALSWASVAGGLSYQGTWNASTNTPTLTSSVGTNGYYYVVATAGSTNLNGITDWQIGDWLLFNGTVWQKIDQSEILQTITSADGSITVSTVGSNVDLSVARATNVVCQVRNTTGATLTKGTAVYISGATGQIPTVSKALATSDATSAQTLGLMSADLTNNTNGYVTVIGLITDIDTSAYTDGAQLYLSGTTAGALTDTKTYAPTHLVYVAVVEHAHPTQGKLFVKVQNGYEMDELHNVSAQSPSSGQTLIYNASTSLWEKANLTAGTGISVSNGAGSITVANTGVTSVAGTTGRITSSGGTTPTIDLASGVVTAGTTGSSTLIPVITVDTYGRVTSITTASNPQGTVTSVTGTSPIVSSGGATPAISLASGYGDTQNPYASKTANYILAAPNGSSGVPTFRAIVAADIPTLNQNTTGTASNVTGTVATTNGGTGLTSFTSGGVVYASSTSALTTGSAFVFNGTNVGIGTSSPSQKLEVSGTAYSQSSVNSVYAPFLARNTNSGSNAYNLMQFGNDASTSATQFGCLGSTNTSYGGVGSTLLLANTGALQAQTQGAYSFIFGTNATERMRIDSSGNLLVGSTSYVYPLAVTSTNNERTAYFRNAYGTGYGGSVIIGESTASAGTGFNLIHLYSNTVAQFRVRGDGTIYAQNTTVQSISDVRVKENIKTATDGLSIINQLRPVRFDFKESFGNNKKNQLGFIAQEMETVFPDAVDEAGEESPDGDKYKSVGPAALIPVLVKAIQELKTLTDTQATIITALTNRIEALENK